ncbi:NAD(P)-binding domain-containing protein [Ideonella sp. DXS29W]|uniref:NAD(P)-binding domain-containing protein n=1 Tax=Ideonella lacteola TaxID=2984193 RepID=A0ABU9BR96_9BURK
MNQLPVVVIGAGPIGLAAISRLLERGETPLVFEAAPHAAAAVRQWSHVRMFSSWGMNMDMSAMKLLKEQGWTAPAAEGFPTGAELVSQYLDPLAKLPAVARCIRYGHRVVSVSRLGFDKLRRVGREEAPFELHIAQASGDHTRVLARAVIDASGTWGSPSPGGHSGLPAVGEPGNPRVAYGIPDVRGEAAGRYAGRDVFVLGGGHSAINVLLDLAASREGGRGQITWVTRGPTPVVQTTGSTVETLLPERASALTQLTALVRKGAIQAVSHFALEEVGQLGKEGRLMLRGLRNGRHSILEGDELVVCTGFRPDLSVLGELHVALDPWLEATAGVGGLIRQAADQGQAIPQPYGAATLAHPERDLFTVGMKSHGRAPNFFLFYGYEQVRSVAAWLAGDMEAANRIDFQLPEGAVCGGCGDGACCGSVGGASACGGGGGGGGCCGTGGSGGGCGGGGCG